jgi:uncharacterized protein YgbK (DUF1537 family)
VALQIGVIADDFTGATDIAGFLVEGGLRTAQLNGVPTNPLPDVDAIVISLKSRSIAPADAVAQSLAAHRALHDAGAERIIFKYCSTFDSTPEGNIGPVTDALMHATGADITVVSPALPVNGRTVYNGYLFVNGVPLDESGMRNHPVTPMTDASLVRLMEGQSEGKAAVIPVTVIDRGADAIRAALAQLREQGIRYAVTDTLTAEHLTAIGEATSELPLVTGGSGIGGGLARVLTGTDAAGTSAANDWVPLEGRAVVFSGSASEMTNKQVAAYREVAPSLAVDVDRLLTEAAADETAYRDEVRAWVLEQPASPAPLVYATADPDTVRGLQQRYGVDTTSATIEGLFAWLATELRDAGVTRFIVAGGETSGIVTTSLGVEGFHIGPQIAPGVPWVRSLDGTLDLALKSGNFGDVDFFSRAQATKTAEESR